MVVTTGKLLLVELDQHALPHRFGREKLFLRLGPVAPENLIWLTQLSHTVHPRHYLGVLRVAAP